MGAPAPVARWVPPSCQIGRVDSPQAKESMGLSAIGANLAAYRRWKSHYPVKNHHAALR